MNILASNRISLERREIYVTCKVQGPRAVVGYKTCKIICLDRTPKISKGLPTTRRKVKRVLTNAMLSSQEIFCDSKLNFVTLFFKTCLYTVHCIFTGVTHFSVQFWEFRFSYR